VHDLILLLLRLRGAAECRAFIYFLIHLIAYLLTVKIRRMAVAELASGTMWLTLCPFIEV
jgi:hypothetical protein